MPWSFCFQVSLTFTAACDCPPASVADLALSEAVAATDGSLADAPVGAQLEAESAVAAQVRSAAEALARNAAAEDDSSPADFAGQDWVAADSSPVAAEADCWGSDTHCARAAPCDSYPGDSSQADC